MSAACRPGLSHMHQRTQVLLPSLWGESWQQETQGWWHEGLVVLRPNTLLHPRGQLFPDSWLAMTVGAQFGLKSSSPTLQCLEYTQADGKLSLFKFYQCLAILQGRKKTTLLHKWHFCSLSSNFPIRLKRVSIKKTIKLVRLQGESHQRAIRDS